MPVVHYNRFAIVFSTVVFALALGGCSHVTKTIQENACFMGTPLEMRTPECHERITTSIYHQNQNAISLQKQKVSIAWGGIMITIGLAALLAGVVVLLVRIWKRSNTFVAQQAWLNRQADRHEQEMARINTRGAAALANAQRVRLPSAPQTLTISTTDNHSLHYRATGRSDTKKAQLIDADEMFRGGLPSLPPAVPTLENAMAYPDKLLIGFDNKGNAITANFGDITTVAFLADSGGGKTSAMMWLAVQVVLKLHAKLAAFDPHGNAVGGESFRQRIEPMRSSFIFKPATKSETPRAIEYINGIIEGKLEGKNFVGIENFLVLVEECNALMNDSEIAEPLGKLTQRMTDEMRKVKGFGFFAIHRPYVQELGRMAHNLQSAFIGKCDARMAASLLSVSKTRLPIDTQFLKKGQALWMGQGMLEPVVIRYPFLSNDEIQKVMPSKPINANLPPIALEAPAPTKTRSALEQQIYDMALEGKSKTAIIKQLFGASGGKAFKEAGEIVQPILDEVKTLGSA